MDSACPQAFGPGHATEKTEKGARDMDCTKAEVMLEQFPVVLIDASSRRLEPSKTE